MYKYGRQAIKAHNPYLLPMEKGANQMPCGNAQSLFEGAQGMTYPASHSQDEIIFWQGYEACKAKEPCVVIPITRKFIPGSPYKRQATEPVLEVVA